MDSRPVGVFDSGVGGLTVLHECLVTLPHEDFVYLGDHARLPYGPRPLAEVRGFAREIGAFLERRDVKLIVVACNSATSAAMPQLQSELSVPVVGVIAPEARAAVQATRNRRVGLLATQATVEAGRYGDLVRALDAGVELHPIACPRPLPPIQNREPAGAAHREARGAVRATRNRRVGLLATQATGEAGRYGDLVRALDAGVELPPIACPRLVPLIESDDPYGDATEEAVREYAAPLKEAGVDTV